MKGVRWVLGFIDDLAGAIYDVMKIPLKCISYLLAGMLIAGVPLYLLAMIFEWIGNMIA